MVTKSPTYATLQGNTALNHPVCTLCCRMALAHNRNTELSSFKSTRSTVQSKLTTA